MPEAAIPDSPSASRYQILEEIGRGGMGVVYRVKDIDLDRDLAMKVLTRVSTSEDQLTDYYTRFLEEVQVTAQLDHPAIVPVIDLGFNEEGVPFYTMHLVKGLHLGQVIDLAQTGKDGWTLTRLLEVLVKICQALAHAHAKGVLHRDLKPDNIMVGDLGEVYVMDWGLAWMLHREDVRDLRLRPNVEKDLPEAANASFLTTMDGTIVGTPAYMAPEQALGKLDEVDELADVYALGSILYRMLSGNPPYMPSDQAMTTAKEVLSLLQTEPPQPLLRAGLKQPAELIAICEKAMARERRQRYPSALALADDLQAYLEGRVVQAHQTGAIIEFKKWVRRNKGVAASLAAAFVALVTMLVVQGISKKKVERSESEAVAALERMAVSQGLRVGKDLDYGTAAYWFHRAEALATDPERAKTHRVRAHIAEQRQTEPIRALMVPMIGEGHRRMDFAPNGAYLVIEHAQEALKQVMDVVGERLLPSSDGGDVFRAVAFCAKTGRIAIVPRSSPNRCEVWSADMARMLTSIPMDDQEIGALAFSPSGQSLFVGAKDGRIFDFAKGAFSETTFLHVPGGQIAFATFDPKGERLMTVLRPEPLGDEQDASLQVFDIAGDGLPLFPPKEHWFQQNLARPGFLREGEVIVYAAKGGWTETAVARTGAVLSRRNEAPTDVRTEPEEYVSSNGGGSMSNTKPLIEEMLGTPRIRGRHRSVLANKPWMRELSLLDGAVIRPVGLNRHEVVAMAISPDGMIAAGWETSGLLRFWSLKESEWKFPAKPDGEVVYSPSGRWITSHRGKVVLVHEVATSQEAGRPFTLSGDTLALAFSPDEKELAVGLDGRRLEFWDWKAGKQNGWTLELPGEVLASRYAPQGGWLAVLCQNGDLLRVERELGKVSLLAKHERLRQTTTGPKALAFTENGRWLVMWSLCEGITVWDCEKGEQATSPAVKEGQHVDLLKVIGNRLVFLEEDALQEWDLDSGTWSRAPLPAGEGEYSHLDVSADGSQILLSQRIEEYASLVQQGPDGTWTWRKVLALGRAASFFVPNTPFAVGVTLSSPSQFVMVDLRDGSALASPLSNDAGQFLSLRMSLQGKSLAAVDASGNGSAKVWDLSVLTEPADQALGDPEDRVVLSELNAGGRDGTIGWEELKGEDWLNHWVSFRQKHPGWHAIPTNETIPPESRPSDRASLQEGLVAHWSFEGDTRNRRKTLAGEALDLEAHGGVRFSEDGGSVATASSSTAWMPT